MPERAAWGSCGLGRGPSHVFADAIGASDSARLAAVASRDGAKAAEFAREYGADRAYGSYDELLADPAIEIVYISTPRGTSTSSSPSKAAQAGKHVLCEKPLGVTGAGAELAIEAARAANVFLMEAFAFRVHPQTRQLVRLVGEGEIGELRMMKLDWGFDAGPTPGSSYYSPTRTWPAGRSPR